MSELDINETLRDLESGRLPDWISEHLKVYRESGGREGHMFDARFAGGGAAVPTLLLTTRGRRSGELHTMPLIYDAVDRAYVIIGSKGGAPTQPAWYHNLCAEPRVELQVGTEIFAAMARTAEGAERARLWQHMVTVYPPFADYQAKTGREIPVVVLERV
ncbi:MAG: nitroreductase family deazaflavin-dependent oxidoreductase [Proteobacteria bacterium]|jgi:deazaflavin-dependent oxidoreductase (nitroreductase family)|nr:nitroreductase family deazaflavin-dependent oxidoreductase [Pseudomonadota bacterium]